MSKKEVVNLMKAAQITRYSKDIHITLNDIPIPEIGDDDILIRVKAAAVNPVDILNLTGADRLSGNHGRTARKTGRDRIHSRRFRQSRTNGSAHCKGVGTPCHHTRKCTGKGCTPFCRCGPVYRVYRGTLLGNVIRHRLYY